jgi:hypothetical protein
LIEAGAIGPRACAEASNSGVSGTVHQPHITYQTWKEGRSLDRVPQVAHAPVDLRALFNGTWNLIATLRFAGELEEELLPADLSPTLLFCSAYLLDWATKLNDIPITRLSQIVRTHGFRAGASSTSLDASTAGLAMLPRPPSSAHVIARQCLDLGQLARQRF